MSGNPGRKPRVPAKKNSEQISDSVKENYSRPKDKESEIQIPENSIKEVAHWLIHLTKNIQDSGADLNSTQKGRLEDLTKQLQHVLDELESTEDSKKELESAQIELQKWMSDLVNQNKINEENLKKSDDKIKSMEKDEQIRVLAEGMNKSILTHVETLGKKLIDGDLYSKVVQKEVPANLREGKPATESYEAIFKSVQEFLTSVSQLTDAVLKITEDLDKYDTVKAERSKDESANQNMNLAQKLEADAAAISTIISRVEAKNKSTEALRENLEKDNILNQIDSTTRLLGMISENLKDIPDEDQEEVRKYSELISDWHQRVSCNFSNGNQDIVFLEMYTALSSFKSCYDAKITEEIQALEEKHAELAKLISEEVEKLKPQPDEEEPQKEGEEGAKEGEEVKKEEEEVKKEGEKQKEPERAAQKVNEKSDENPSTKTNPSIEAESLLRDLDEAQAEQIIKIPQYSEMKDIESKIQEKNSKLSTLTNSLDTVEEMLRTDCYRYLKKYISENPTTLPDARKLMSLEYVDENNKLRSELKKIEGTLQDLQSGNTEASLKSKIAILEGEKSQTEAELKRVIEANNAESNEDKKKIRELQENEILLKTEAKNIKEKLKKLEEEHFKQEKEISMRLENIGITEKNINAKQNQIEDQERMFNNQKENYKAELARLKKEVAEKQAAQKQLEEYKSKYSKSQGVDLIIDTSSLIDQSPSLNQTARTPRGSRTPKRQNHLNDSLETERDFFAQKNQLKQMISQLESDKVGLEEKVKSLGEERAKTEKTLRKAGEEINDLKEQIASIKLNSNRQTAFPGRSSTHFLLYACSGMVFLMTFALLNNWITPVTGSETLPVRA